MSSKGNALESPAMRSSEAATGTRSRMPVCSRSTGTTRRTTGTTSASADPRTQHPGDGCAVEGHSLGRAFPAASAAKAWQSAPSETVAGASAAAAESDALFTRLTTFTNLHECWQKARLNKGGRLRIQRFADDALHYINLIQGRLRAGTYTFGPYQVFTVRDKKWRDVIDAPMKDRIVHWMLYRHLLSIWLPRFIHDTYGNLPERGTQAAVLRLANFARKQDARWVLQLDISKYFYAVPHDKLKARALRYVGDESLRRLIVSLIDSFQTDDRYDHLFPAGWRDSPRGMPIGNLPSQFFANIYLCDFDHWCKETLGLRWYIRYVDDIVILGRGKEELQAIATQIIERLTGEGLTINPRKMRIAPVNQGVPFLGYIVWPNRISAGQYLRHRYHHRLRQHESGYQDRSEALNSYRAALALTGATR